MKRILLLATLALIGALVPAATAKTATTTTVSITATGFVPSTITVNAGDTVKWTNNDTKNQRVSCAKCKFDSGVLSPNQSYSFTFQNAGTFAITDPISNAKGTVTVTAPKVSVTLDASPHTVKFLAPTTFSGSVSTSKANQKVTLLAQTCGSSTLDQVAVTRTGTGGSYTLVQPPTMNTTYTAQVATSKSTPASVRVIPVVTLHRIATNRYKVGVKAGSSLAGKHVLFQRRKSNGRWVTSKNVTLKVASKVGSQTYVTTRAFSAKVKHGLRVRARLTAGQAAPCYLGARSASIKAR
jgi:plastocyanin